MSIDDKLATLRAALNLVREEAAKPDALPHWRDVLEATERGLCALVSGTEEERGLATNDASAGAFVCCNCGESVPTGGRMWWDKEHATAQTVLRACSRGCYEQLVAPDCLGVAEYIAAGWDASRMPE